MSIFGGNSGGVSLSELQTELAGIQPAVQGETKIFSGSSAPAGWTETGSWPAFTSTYGFTLGATQRFPRRADTVYERYSLHSYTGCIDHSTGDYYYCYNQPASTTNVCTIEVIRANGAQEFFTSYVDNLQQTPVMAMVCDGTYLYMMGGYTNTGTTAKQDVFRINKSTKVKTTMASLPTTGIAYGSAVWDGADKIHFFGGTNYSAYQSAIKTYTISTNAWATRTAVLGTAKAGITSALLPSGKIWVGSGGGGSASNVYQIFNPANDTITAETTFASKGLTVVAGAAGTAPGLICNAYYNNNWCRGGYTEATDSFIVDPNHTCNEAFLSYGPAPITATGDIYWCNITSGMTQAYDYGVGSKSGAIVSGPLVNRYGTQTKQYIIAKKN